MKVLIVTPSYYPIVGGSEALTRTLSTKLIRKGVHTDIMTFNMNEKWYPVWRQEIQDNEDCKIIKVAAMNPFSAFAINPLHMLSRINVLPKPSFREKFDQYDVIHFLGEADLTFPFYSYFVQKPKILHCVATYFLLKYYQRHALLRKPFKQLFPRLADLYIVSGSEEKEYLCELGVPASKISILPIGVDVDTFCPDETKKLDNLLLFVGRIDRIKGLHLLLSAFPHIEIPTQLVIIGPKWDPEYVKAIERMSHRINENGFHKVKILPPVGRNDLVPWYQKATVVVCPYLFEPYSNIVREALACGTPVVSTGKHIIQKGCDGILVSPKNPKKLANALTKLLEDKKMRKKYSRQARKTAELHLSWESIVQDLTKLYMDLLDDWT